MRAWLLFIIFLAGLGLGFGASTVAPKYLGSYFPKSLTPPRDGVQGTVVKKQAEEDRLLLTISASDGALLATFRKSITEISLLVDEGDSVTLDVRVYSPFVTDPPILRVKKPDGLLTPMSDPVPDESQVEISPSIHDSDSDVPEPELLPVDPLKPGNQTDHVTD